MQSAEILPEEIEAAVKGAAEVSMGTEITDEDLDNIQALAEQVVGFTEYRSQLSSYLSARMKAIAPNLTELVGDLVGARLIAHAGSLMNLAKSPASTLQILGAEKALFRALKTKHDTPKYGLIYHASLIGQATGKNKGKMARMLATKTALGLRVDALSDWGAEGEGKGDGVTEEEKSITSVLNREKLERRLAALEGRPLRSKGVAIAPNGVSFQPTKFEIKEARKYNHDADGLTGNEAPAAVAKESKKEKKKKKLIEEIPEEPKLKKAKMEKMEGIKSFKEVVKDAVEEEIEESDDGAESSDIDMEQEPEPELKAQESVAVAPVSKERSNGVKKDANGDDVSETISTVSDDSADSAPSPTQQEINWQSKIEGNTKVAKKARKKERHARRLALSDERSASRQKERARLARRLDRKERRQKRAEQIERREERQASRYGALAKAAGLSIARYQRKLERGEIHFEADGTPVAISKKEIKKARKGAEKTSAVKDDESSKKRKRESEGGNGAEEVGKEKEKKKKKKSKSVEA